MIKASPRSFMILSSTVEIWWKNNRWPILIVLRTTKTFVCSVYRIVVIVQGALNAFDPNSASEEDKVSEIRPRHSVRVKPCVTPNVKRAETSARYEIAMTLHAPNDPSSTTRPTGHDCNRGARAGSPQPMV